jgi:tellurite methyltransferase
LGAGIGRHALALAEAGHHVTALDAAEAATAAIAAAAFAKGLTITTVEAPMTDLPFEPASFDHVLAWNVIYHGDEAVVRRTLAEVARVLRPGGNFMATMLSARRLPVEQARAKGREISRNTWVFEGPGDKVHPHYFCDASDLVSLLWGFELLTLFDRPHTSPGSWHWHLLAERLS